MEAILFRSVKYVLLIVFVFILNSVEIGLAYEAAGHVTAIKGEVRCRRVRANSIETDLLRLKSGDSFLIADILETGANGKVQILLNDQSLVTVMPGSVLRISQFSFYRDEGRMRSVLLLKNGRIHFNMSKSLKSISSLKIETDLAFIQTALGDVVVDSSALSTELFVLAGSATINNIPAIAGGATSIGENQSVVVRSKEPPTNPSVIPLQQRRKFKRDVRQF